MSSAFRLAIAANIVVAMIIFPVVVTLGGGITVGVFPPLQRPTITLIEVDASAPTGAEGEPRAVERVGRHDSVPERYRPREASPAPWKIREDGTVEFRD